MTLHGHGCVQGQCRTQQITNVSWQCLVQWSAKLASSSLRRKHQTLQQQAWQSCQRVAAQVVSTRCSGANPYHATKPSTGAARVVLKFSGIDMLYSSCSFMCSKSNAIELASAMRDLASTASMTTCPARTLVKTRQKASFRIRFFLTTRTTLRFGKGMYSANLLVNAVER